VTFTAEPDAILLANELRHAMRPIWRRQLAEGGMSLGKRGVLQHLFRHEPSTPADLAAAEQVKPQSMTTMLHELEQLGLVERTSDPTDGRKAWIRLSAAGRTWVLDQRMVREGWLVTAVGEVLTAEERAILLSALPVLRKLTGQTPLEDGDADVEQTRAAQSRAAQKANA
jgi:DNA-binding MarR family transcriptional regulator